MEYIFALKVLMSFLVAGTWITAATLIAERYGSKIGGLLTSLPSNIVVSLLFVALTHHAKFAAEVSLAVPSGMSVLTIFLFVFIILLRYGIVLSSILSILSWFALAFIANMVKIENLVIGIILYLGITLLAFYLLESVFKIRSTHSKEKKYTVAQIGIRSVFSGSAVSGAVLISSFAGSYWAGIFSTFPAVTIPTIIILSINQSTKFAQATAKILLLSLTNIIVYSLGVYFTYPVFGIIIGTLVSFIGSCIYVWVLHRVLKRLSLE